MYSVWNLNNPKLLYFYSYPTLNSPLENAKLQALVKKIQALNISKFDCLDLGYCMKKQMTT